jgi:hypothetical protein
VNTFLVTLPLIVALGCLVARWILVIGFGDLGTDYDLVSRLAAQQWQGADFYSTFPPLPGYCLLLFDKLFGSHYVATSIHVWFWWAVNAFVARQVMVVLGGTAARAGFVAMAVALLTAPPNMHMVAFAYIASALSGIAAICLWRYAGTRYPGRALLAGVFGGLATLAKPNVGLAIVASMTAVCWGHALVQRAPRERPWSGGLWVVSGAAVGLVGAIALPGWHGGYAEILKEVFVGGAQLKGGLLGMAARILPRISTTMTSPHRVAFEFAVTLLPLTLASVACLRILRDPGRQDAEASPDPAVVKLLWVLTGTVAVLSLWSLFPQEFPHRLTAFFHGIQVVSLPFLLWQALYVAVLVALVASLVVGVRRKEFEQPLTSPLWVSCLCLVWTLGVVASARHNIVFAATLFCPAIGLRYGQTRRARFSAWMTALLILWTLSWHVAPNWRSTFARLTALPSEGRFSHLYWPEGGASVPGSYPVWSSSKTILELQRHVAPLVAGKTVLWLFAGPGAAFGGTPHTFGIHAIAANNVPLWVETKFGEGVRSHPPDYIVSSDFRDWDDRKWSFMRPDVIEPWLVDHYRLVWRSADDPAAISLWQRK